MAEVKVESVDNLTKNNDLTAEVDSYKQQAQQSANSVNDVRPPFNTLILSYYSSTILHLLFTLYVFIHTIMQRDRQILELKTQLEAAEARAGELERRLSNRQTEAHVLKKALDQYKHQIANLTQELDILRGRMKKAGLIQEAHSVLPHSNSSTTDSGSGDETLKAFAAEQARMVASEAELGLQSKAEDGDGSGTALGTAARKIGMGDGADSKESDDMNSAELGASARDALQRAKAEAEAAAATKATTI